jgi:ribose 5-phosphate isomerase B
LFEDQFDTAVPEGQFTADGRWAAYPYPWPDTWGRGKYDANVIALGARLIGPEMARACVDTFLSTPFGGGRHQRRVDKLSHPSFAKEPA